MRSPAQIPDFVSIDHVYTYVELSVIYFTVVMCTGYAEIMVLADFTCFAKSFIWIQGLRGGCLNII